jgi:hypothetical protein
MVSQAEPRSSIVQQGFSRTAPASFIDALMSLGQSRNLSEYHLRHHRRNLRIRPTSELLWVSHGDAGVGCAWFGSHALCSDERTYFLDIIANEGLWREDMRALVIRAKQLARDLRGSTLCAEFYDASCDYDGDVRAEGMDMVLEEVQYRLSMADAMRRIARPSPTEGVRLRRLAESDELCRQTARFLAPRFGDMPHAYPVGNLDCAFMLGELTDEATVLEASVVACANDDVIGCFCIRDYDGLRDVAEISFTVIEPRFRSSALFADMWSASYPALLDMGFRYIDRLRRRPPGGPPMERHGASRIGRRATYRSNVDVS